MRPGVGDHMRKVSVDAILEAAFKHPMKMVVSALGVPPDYMVERARANNVPSVHWQAQENRALSSRQRLLLEFSMQSPTNHSTMPFRCTMRYPKDYPLRSSPRT